MAYEPRELLHVRNNVLRVLKRLSTVNSFGRIERKQLLKQIKGKRRSGGIKRLELYARFDRKGTNIAIESAPSCATRWGCTHSCALLLATLRRVSSVGVPRRSKILFS
jgi:hypothetical protein